MQGCARVAIVRRSAVQIHNLNLMEQSMTKTSHGSSLLGPLLKKHESLYMPPLIYNPLDFKRREIRLLNLLPGSSDDPVRCRISAISLDSYPTYEALSYTWGDLTSTHCVLMQDVDTIDDEDVVLMEVTTNLYEALQDLRWVDRSRTIWIDQLCINQKNTLERSAQVAEMGTIYQRARRVVAWVGGDAAVMGLAYKTFAFLATNPALHYTLKSERNPQSDWSSGVVRADTLNAIAAFVNRPWWDRMWTSQEAILPKDFVFSAAKIEVNLATVIQGDENFIRHAISCCMGLGGTQDSDCFKSHAYKNTHVQRLRNNREKLHQDKLVDPIYLVMSHHRQQCHDPRDMVYGLLAVLDATYPTHPLLIPDYHKKTAQVFEEATAKISLRYGALDLLTTGYRSRPVYSGSSRNDDSNVLLPSWVFNFDSYKMLRSDFVFEDRVHTHKIFIAAGPGAFSGRYHGGGRLTVQGKSIGIVRSVGEPWERNMGPENQAELIRHWARSAGIQDSEWERGSRHLSFSRFRRRYPRIEIPSGRLGHQPYGYFEAFLLTLLGGIDPWMSQQRKIALLEHKSAWKTWPLLQRFGEDIVPPAVGTPDHVAAAQDGSEFKMRTEYRIRVATMCAMRRLIKTQEDRGLIGIAHMETQVGDTIVLVQGSRVPLILRETRDTEGRRAWTFVGDSYIHGVMHGEGLALEGDWQEFLLI
jgi:hypothetical protein